jgi:hypothetical protein
MLDYVDEILAVFDKAEPKGVGTKTSTAPDSLFKVNEDCEKLAHSLDRVFRGLNNTDGPHRQEPASVKKLLKGDTTWETRKTVLGWVLDTVDKTIQLPHHRVERLHAILAGIPSTQRHTSTKNWQQVIGPEACYVPCRKRYSIRLTMAPGCAWDSMSTPFWKISVGSQRAWPLGQPAC